jgi:hypothetical protein
MRTISDGPAAGGVAEFTAIAGDAGFSNIEFYHPTAHRSILCDSVSLWEII